MGSFATGVFAQWRLDSHHQVTQFPADGNNLVTDNSKSQTDNLAVKDAIFYYQSHGLSPILSLRAARFT